MNSKLFHIYFNVVKILGTVFSTQPPLQFLIIVTAQE